MSAAQFIPRKLKLPIIPLTQLSVFTLFIFCCRAGAFAWEITGNTKTKTPHILSALDKCPSSYGAQKCLLNTKLFAEVEVTGETIAVKERRTLIILPVISSSGSQKKAGAYLIESNFLGCGNLLVAGGAVSNRGADAAVIYRNNAVNFSDFTFSASFAASEKNYELYAGQNDRFEYRDNTFSLGAGPGYRFGFFEAGVKAAYEKRRFDKFENFDALEITPSLRYKNVSFKFHSEEG